MKISEAIATMADLAKASACDEFDIVGYDSFSESVEVFEGKVSNTEIQSASAIGIRTFKNSRPGIAFTEKLSPDALKICLSDALSHTELTDPVLFTVADLQPASGINFDHLSPEFDAVGFSDLTKLAIDLENTARSLDKRIENVPYTGAGRSSGTSFFLNSRGVAYEHAAQEFSAYSAAVGMLGEQKKMGFYSNSRLKFSDLPGLRIAERAVERTIEQLGAAPVPHGKYTVLFTNRASGQIMSLYQSPYFAELAIRGQSRLKGRLGEMIASPQLTLLSQAHAPLLKGSRARDGEGVPTRDLDVIRDGKFVNFLYNLEAAAIDKVAPTGNAVRSVSSKAGTGFKNLVVAPGNKTAAELAAAGTVLVIDKLEGSAGCSPVSGELSIGAQGYLSVDGKRMQPVDRITLSSNYFEMLKNIEAVSSEYNDQYSSVRVPDLLIGGISVAG